MAIIPKLDTDKIGLPTMEKLAVQLTGMLEPFCDRVEVAGSVRRQVPFVSDLELLVIPRLTYEHDLFGEITNEVSELDILVTDWISTGRVSVRVGNGPKNKMLIFRSDDGVALPIDIFVTTFDNWGMSLVVRTGSAAFIKGLMARLRQQGHAGHAYGMARYCNVTHASHTKACGLVEMPSSVTLHRARTDRREVSCRTEAEVFDLAVMNYLEPQFRK